MLISVILAMFMSAVEATIVGTAMPSIVGELGGFSLFSWVFSAYLLMLVVSVPIYGKLADMYGRKRIFSIGITIFLIGSLLCGFARSIKWLIIARFIQGLGGGAVQPIATTIIGDIYTKEERAKIQGYLASVWGISSLIGPLLGGIFVEYIHWSWVFWINLPFGIFAMIGVILFLKETMDNKKREIDFVGAFLLFLGVSSLMIVLVQGGVHWPWNSLAIISLLIVFTSCLILFYFQEKRAKEPIISLAIWKHRLISISNTASFTLGAVLIGISSFLPAYVQIAMNQSPMLAGFTLTMISVGWPISSTIAGKILLKIGYRNTALIGAIALMIGGTLFVTLPYVGSPLWAAIGSFFLGAGMGFTTTTFIVSIQSSVAWNERGSATATNMFMRSLGGAVGVALLGGILNNRLNTQLSKYEELISADIDVASILLNPTKELQLSVEQIHLFQQAFSYSISGVYFGVYLLVIVSFILIYFLPKQTENEK